MDYAFQLLEEPKVIVVTITGEWNSDMDTSMGLEIMSKEIEWNVYRVVVDMRALKFEIRLADIFQRATDLNQQRRELKVAGTRVAIVYNPINNRVVDDFKFFENTAQNRGAPYRVFTEMDAALEWLAK